MFASPVDQKAWVRIGFRYLLVTAFCALFGGVYEAFSHGVYAYGMLYGFAFPLLGGALPAAGLSMLNRPLPSPTARQLWRFGISALTVGSLFSGALEIYGTSSRLTKVYWIAGGLCLTLSLLAELVGQAAKKKAAPAT